MDTTAESQAAVVAAALRRTWPNTTQGTGRYRNRVTVRGAKAGERGKVWHIARRHALGYRISVAVMGLRLMVVTLSVLES